MVIHLQIMKEELDGMELTKALLYIKDRIKKHRQYGRTFQLSESSINQLINFKQRNYDGELDGTRVIRLWLDGGILIQQILED